MNTGDDGSTDGQTRGKVIDGIACIGIACIAIVDRNLVVVGARAADAGTDAGTSWY